MRTTGKCTIATIVTYTDPESHSVRARKMTLVADWTCDSEESAREQYRMWKEANPMLHLTGSYEVFFTD